MRNGIVFGSARNANQAIFEINIVPLVDVLLVLTIFFMFVAPLMRHQIDANGSFRGGCFGPATSPVVRIVEILPTSGEKPSVALDGMSLGIEELVVAIDAQARKRPEETAEIYLKAAPDAAFAHMVKVLAIVNSAGIERVHLDDISGSSASVPTSARFRLVND